MSTAQKKTVRLDPDLHRQATEAAEREGVSVGRLVEQAVQSYLGQRPKMDVEDPVAASWGAIPIDAKLFKQIMEEEEGVLDI
ncbi:MAG: toxin-antitoxin system HicB family antitoxin [Chloroflexi bacterium]|nr:toxin-antitoxin system HicB family antitoxin [Chloroflexota bacterium]